MMRLTLLVFCLLSAVQVYAHSTSHKSEAKIAKMTPDQRVQEYCDEYYHHSYEDRDYIDMVNSYVLKDGINALPAITRIIREFDPTTSKGKSRRKDATAFAAEDLLSQLDRHVIRVRAIPEGKTAIEAMRRLVQLMLTAHFDTADVANGETSDRYRYEASKDELKKLEGLNHFDNGIKETLRIRYKIRLSDQQMLDFVNYLITQEPRYPTWGALEFYKDLADRNEAGYPRQYLVLKKPEPFYKLYLQYKACCIPYD